MADTTFETITLVRIDTGESVQTVAELKKYIADLKTGVDNLDIGTADYVKTLKALQEAQAAQKEAMNLDVQAKAVAEKQTKALTDELAALDKQLGVTDDLFENAAISAQIQAIEGELEGLGAVLGESASEARKTFEDFAAGGITMGELKDYISETKDALSEMQIGTEEYNATLKDLQAAQDAQKDAMHFGVEGATALKGSYNELVHTMRELMEQWRATGDEAERDRIGQQINAINDRLKELDSSVGNNKRKVGDYANEFAKGLSSMGGGAAKAVTGIKGVTGALKAMSATPVIAILGILATVLDKIMKELKGTEEGTNALTASMAPFSAIGDAITKMLQGLGIVLAKVVGWMGNLTRAIIGNNEAAEKRLELAKKQAELDASMRERMVQDAKDEKEVAELRAKASERLTYTAKERLEFLQEAGRLEGEISKRGVEDARKQYEIIKARNAMSKSGKDELDEEARAYADMIKAETSYFVQLRQINQGITRARKELIKEERDAAKAVRDAATAKINAEKDYLTQLLGIVKTGTESEFKIQNSIAKKEYELAVANARQKVTNAKELQRTLEMLEKAFHIKLRKNQQDHDNKVLADQLKAIANRRDALQKGSVEYAQAEQEYARASLDGLKRQMDETDAEFKARQLAAQRNLVQAGNAVKDALLKETVGGLTAQMEGLRKGSVEQLALAAEAAKVRLEGIYQGIDESLDEFNARRLKAEKDVRKALQAVEEAEVENGRILFEQRMAQLEEDSADYLAVALELKQYELNTLYQLEEESDDAFRLRKLQKTKELADAEKAIWQKQLTDIQTYATGLGGILTQIGDMYVGLAEDQEKAENEIKGLRIAAAVIDTISGAIGAFMSGVNSGLPAPYNMILGAAQAATTTALGMTNVAKLRQSPVRDRGGGSSIASPNYSSAVVSAPPVVQQVPVTRSVTTATEDARAEKMAQDQRVYLVYSDVEEAGRYVDVVQEESEF